MSRHDKELIESMYLPTKVRGAGRLMVPSELGHTPYVPPKPLTTAIDPGGVATRQAEGRRTQIPSWMRGRMILPTGDTGEFGDTDEFGDTGDTGVGDTGDTGDTGYFETPPLDPRMADDFAYYQSKIIYGGGAAKDPNAAEKANADLNRRLNLPGEMGTISSSEDPDWRGTGWTMHEIVGKRMTRYFLENPDTGEAYNITGHPKAGRE